MNRSDRRIAVLASAVLGTAGATGLARAGDPMVPPGFAITQIVSDLTRPVKMVFTGDGRIFVTEMRGMVHVIENGVRLPEPFIDLTAEVNGRGERGLLGIALDPDFLSNHKVYLLYTVDPVFGDPDEDPSVGTFGRLTCYTGTEESNGNVADPASRCVLIGATWPEGIPVCESSHTVGTVLFGRDGSLFVGAGDGARFGPPDSGGQDPECFGVGRISEDQDIGSFRAQYLGSLAGKILRVDPATGLGLPSNPHWTGDGADTASKIWVNGLRNPYRFALGRAAGPGPGTLFIGDVGRAAYEEVDVANGGENFGWPCREGFHAAPVFPDPPHSGCDTIETKSNPGPLTDPIMDMHHTDSMQSNPPDVASRCVIGGVFYEGSCYPKLYQGAYFYMDQRLNWIRVAEVNEQNEIVATHAFVDDLFSPVDIASDPLTGDLFVAAWETDRNGIFRIRYVAPGCGEPCPADIDGNGAVDFSDLLAVLSGWGPCGLCPEDLDGNGVVDFADILLLLSSWGPCPG